MSLEQRAQPPAGQSEWAHGNDENPDKSGLRLRPRTPAEEEAAAAGALPQLDLDTIDVEEMEEIIDFAEVLASSRPSAGAPHAEAITIYPASPMTPPRLPLGGYAAGPGAGSRRIPTALLTTIAAFASGALVAALVITFRAEPQTAAREQQATMASAQAGESEAQAGIEDGPTTRTEIATTAATAAETDAVTETEAAADTEAAAETDAVTETEAVADTEAAAETEAAADTEVATDIETETVTAPATVTETEPTAVAATTTETVAEVEAASETTEATAMATEPIAAAAAAAQVLPSRAQVVAAVEGTRSQVVQCAEGQHGRLDIQVVFVSSGRVTRPRIHGAFAGTPAGSCMARAIRSMRVPPFRNAELAVSYPMHL